MGAIKPKGLSKIAKNRLRLPMYEENLRFINNYIIQSTGRVSKITIIRYAQSQKTGKSNNRKVFGSKKTNKNI